MSVKPGPPQRLLKAPDLMQMYLRHLNNLALITYALGRIDYAQRFISEPDTPKWAGFICDPQSFGWFFMQACVPDLVPESQEPPPTTLLKEDTGWPVGAEWANFTKDAATLDAEHRQELARWGARLEARRSELERAGQHKEAMREPAERQVDDIG